MLIETHKVNDLVLKIYYDDDTYYQLDDLFDNPDVKFMSNHRDYKSINTNDNLGKYHSMNEVSSIYEGYEIVPIFAYIHSGIALSLGEFNCKWDSGLFGLLLYKKSEFPNGVKSFVDTWSSILNGEIYGYTLEREIFCQSCNSPEYQDIDSCWGFVGHDFKNMIDNLDVDNEIIEQFKKVV